MSIKEKLESVVGERNRGTEGKTKSISRGWIRDVYTNWVLVKIIERVSIVIEIRKRDEIRIGEVKIIGEREKSKRQTVRDIENRKWNVT